MGGHSRDTLLYVLLRSLWAMFSSGCMAGDGEIWEQSMNACKLLWFA